MSTRDTGTPGFLKSRQKKVYSTLEAVYYVNMDKIIQGYKNVLHTLSRDARRYRWLRENASSIIVAGKLLKGDGLDEAIDWYLAEPFLPPTWIGSEPRELVDAEALEEEECAKKLKCEWARCGDLVSCMRRERCRNGTRE